jgi:hypothetical protein
MLLENLVYRAEFGLKYKYLPIAAPSNQELASRMFNFPGKILAFLLPHVHCQNDCVLLIELPYGPALVRSVEFI